jgi:hypothetical protein
MVDEDADPTPDELREAAALARALDGEAPGAAAPRDALETAALLRYARDGGALAPERERAIAARLRERGPRRSRTWRIAAPVLGGSLALAASLLLLLRTGGPELSLDAPLPGALLEAQARAVAREPGALAALDVEMQRHRRELHARLGLGSGARP